MKKLLNVIKNLAFLGVGVFLFWLVYKNVDFGKIGEQVSKLNYWYILLAFIAAVISHWSRGARWVLLIKPVGYKISNFNAFLAVMIGYFANVAVPRLGEVSRCLVLNRTNKVGVDKLLGTVIVERLVDVISLLLILILTLIFQFDKISSLFLKFFNTPSHDASGAESGRLFTGTFLVMAIAAFVVIMIIGFLLLRKFKEHRLVVQLKSMIIGFKAGFSTILKLDNLGIFIFHSVLIWSMYYVMVYVCFFALPFTAGLGPSIALAVLCMGSFGFVAPVPGGVGAYHWIVTQTLIWYGLKPDESATWALVGHTFQEMVIVLLGGLSFIYFSLAFKKLKADEPVASHKAETVLQD